MKKILTATAVALCIIGCSKTTTSSSGHLATAGDETEEEETDTTPRVGSYIFSNDTIAVTITVTKLTRPYRSFLSVFNDICPMESGFPYWQSYSMWDDISGEWPDYACVYSNSAATAVKTGFNGSIELTIIFDDPFYLTATVNENTAKTPKAISYFDQSVYLPEVMNFQYNSELDIKVWD